MKTAKFLTYLVFVLFLIVPFLLVAVTTIQMIVQG